MRRITILNVVRRMPSIPWMDTNTLKKGMIRKDSICLKLLDKMVFNMLKTPENDHLRPPAGDAPPVDAVRELTETVQRVQADFENYRKRSQNEMTLNYLRGKAAALKDMLGIIDTLDSAISKEKDATRHALENIRTHMLHILSQSGVKPIHTIGKVFDPFTSECLMQGNDANQGEDIVLEEMQRGYYFHDDVLRPAKVKVNKRREENENKMNNDNQSNNTTGGINHE